LEIANMLMRLACLNVLLALLATPGRAADPDALWRIVSGQCVVDEQEHHSPAPCAAVDLAGGYAVLKDRDGDTQYLLIPTTRVSGIESPAILAPDAPNYWADAWQARKLVDERAHRELPRDAISLAINSIDARSQNQLHIHIDCVRLDVQAALREHAADIGPQWSRFPVPLAGHNYLAIRLTQAELGATNPFKLLADGMPGARDDMRDYTLVVVGTADGFVLLAGHATGIGDRGHGEELQDHTCAAAH
jgi:CDP-diacylglycerol pyrophosphatase